MNRRTYVLNALVKSGDISVRCEVRKQNSNEMTSHLIHVATHLNRVKESHFVLQERDCLIARHYLALLILRFI